MPRGTLRGLLWGCAAPWLGLAQPWIDGGGGLVDPNTTNRPPTLDLRAESDGRLGIRGDYYDGNGPPRVFTLEASADLDGWRPEAVLLTAPFHWRHDGGMGSDREYFRLRVTDRTVDNDWANQTTLGGDGLLGSTASDCYSRDRFGWVKFIILEQDPGRVWFQNSSKYPLHYDFAVSRLPEFQGMSPGQFNAVTLRRSERRAVLGTVLAPFGSADYGIQFVGLDPYTPEEIVRWFGWVQDAVAPPGGGQALYVPTFEQAAAARVDAAWFAARGIRVVPLEEWRTDRSVCYSPGWAVGRLAFVPASEIGPAYADGRLRPDDILVTDGVPAEVPYVAGILSLSPATPNSHVAILAESYGVPFAYLADPAERARVRALGGHEVAVRTGAALGACQVQVLDLGPDFDPALKEALQALKRPGAIHVPSKEPYGAFSAPADPLAPSDIRFFGGKAANYGLLRRTIPGHAPEAVAFSFDLWDAFLAQTLPGGGTLRQFIEARVGRHSYPPDVRALRADLEAVRATITAVADFDPRQREAILAALAPFDPTRKIRFRSSTNVEDSERFTGAGLYDSYSGCLADELDGDDAGPCRCDADERHERGVFRALRRVYASFYNENAVLERLRFQVDERTVGMAVLVHPSTPDEFEEANGVATVDAQRIGAGWFLNGRLVTQAGAVSVTNPSGAASPEVVTLEVNAFGTNVWLTQSSTLIPLGSRVLSWPDRYLELATLVRAVTDGYTVVAAPRDRFRLDLEYKQAAGHLVIKQVREIPTPPAPSAAPAFLLREPLEFLVTGDVFAVHRLKSRWRLQTGHFALGMSSLPGPVFEAMDLELVGAQGGLRFGGPPTSWPQATVTTRLEPGRVWSLRNSWRASDEPNAVAFTLWTRLPQSVAASECPWRTVRDATIECSARYPAPVPLPGPAGETLWRDAESVRLFLGPWSLPADALTLSFTASNGVMVSTFQQMASEYASRPTSPVRPPCSIVAGGEQYSWVGVRGETRIEGLLPEPLVLRSEAAQTLVVRGRTGHEHVEEFVGEPWLEPHLTPDVQAALTQANVRLLYVRRYRFGQTEERALILGLDGRFRDAVR